MPSFSPLVLGFTVPVGLSWLLARVITLRRLVFLRRAVRVPGKVVAIAQIEDSGAFPVIAFETREGLSMKLQSGLSGQKGAELGKQVNVLYEPDDPSEAMLDAWETLWFLPGFLVMLGGAFAVLAIVVAFLV